MQHFDGEQCFPRNTTHDCASKRKIMCSTYRHKGGMQNNFSWERCKIPQLFCTAKSCLLDTRNGTSPSKSYFKHFLIPNILVKFKLNEYFILQKGVFYSIECPCINNSIWPKMQNHVNQAWKPPHRAKKQPVFPRKYKLHCGWIDNNSNNLYDQNLKNLPKSPMVL